MTDEETIKDLREGLEDRWNKICHLQRKYMDKLYKENLEGNMATAEDYFKIVADIQELLENL